MRTTIKILVLGLALAACGGGGLEVPEDAECPNVVFASTGPGLCGVVHEGAGVAYPCVSTCEAADGTAPVAPGCKATARMRGPFDDGVNGPNAVGGVVICGCGEFCK
jgi:hypothetical protein